VLDPVAGTVDQILDPIAGTIDQTLEPVLDPVAGTLDQTLAPVLDPVAGVIDQTVSPVLDPVAGVIDQTLSPVLDPVAGTIDQTVAPVLQPVVGAVEPLIQPVVGPVGDQPLLAVDPRFDPSPGDGTAAQGSPEPSVATGPLGAPVAPNMPSGTTTWSWGANLRSTGERQYGTAQVPGEPASRASAAETASGSATSSAMFRSLAELADDGIARAAAPGIPGDPKPEGPVPFGGSSGIGSIFSSSFMSGAFYALLVTLLGIALAQSGWLCIRPARSPSAAFVPILERPG
jgi:hypothetical protein